MKDFLVFHLFCNSKNYTPYYIIKKVEIGGTMQNQITLDSLPINTCAKIFSVNCDKKTQNRIFDLGITENAIITPVFKSPFNDPTAYYVKNTLIALRKKDSKNILVIPL